MRRSPNTLPLVFAGFLACIGFFASAASVNAQTQCTDPLFFAGTCSGPASTYQFTLQAFRLRPQGGGTPVPLTTSSQLFNVGTSVANPGAEVGTWASGLSVLATTYDAFIVEMTRTFTASGSISLSGRPTCNTGTISADIPTPSAAVPGATFEDIGGNVLKVTATSVPGFPLTVNQGQSVNITVSMDAGSGIQYVFPVAGACSSTTLGSLSVNMTFTVTGP